MLQATTKTSDTKGSGGWRYEETLQLAWTTWVVLLFTPFVVLPFALHMSPGVSGGGPKPDLALTWFFIVTSYLLIGLTVAGAVRLWTFKSFWRTHDVTPRKYFVGVFIPWAVVAVAGLAAELVCVITGTILPNIFPAMFALMIYLVLWPRGTAMEPSLRAKKISK